MVSSLSPKNVALALLGAAVLGLGAVVAVDHTAGASHPARQTSLVASTKTTSSGDALAAASITPTRIIGMIATELGVTPDVLTADVKAGETLDQIAGPRGAQVKANALAALTAALDRLVTKGVITQDQAKSLQADAKDAINQVFAAKLGKLFHQG